MKIYLGFYMPVHMVYTWLLHCYKQFKIQKSQRLIHYFKPQISAMKKNGRNKWDLEGPSSQSQCSSPY